MEYWFGPGSLLERWCIGVRLEFCKDFCSWFLLGLYWLAKRIANQFSVKAIVILACFGGAGAALDRCWIADASVLDHVSN